MVVVVITKCLAIQSEIYTVPHVMSKSNARSGRVFIHTKQCKIV